MAARGATGSVSTSIGRFSGMWPAIRPSAPMAASVRRWRAMDGSAKAIRPKRSARASAAAMALRSGPKTGARVTVRTASTPGSETQAMM